MYNSYLAHHGIKGQRWGIRRYQNEDGTLTDAGKRRMNPNKAIKKMSDDELEKITHRLTLESQYKNLRYEDTRRGREAVSKAIKIIGVVGVASVGVASITVGKEALKNCGKMLGEKMATTIHDSMTSALKSASESAVKNVSNTAENVLKNAKDSVKNAVKSVANGKITDSQRFEAINKATEIGRKAAERALREGKISSRQASEYANKIRQQAYAQIIRKLTE